MNDPMRLDSETIEKGRRETARLIQAQRRAKRLAGNERPYNVLDESGAPCAVVGWVDGELVVLPDER